MTRGTRTRRRFLALCGASAATLSGCSAIPFGRSRSEPNAQQATSSTGTWPTFAYDRANTGHNPKTSEPSAEQSLWESFVEGYYSLPTPVVVGDGVYVGSSDYLYAIERASGKRRWSHRLGVLADRFTATVVGETVYAAGRGKADLANLEVGDGLPGTVVALNRSSGEEQWRQEGYVSGSPTVVDDLLYYPTNTARRGTVRAIDRTDGTERWRFAFGNEGTSAFATPAYADGTLFVLGNRGKHGLLYALDPAMGKPQWHYETNAAAYVAPIVANGQVMIATADGTIHVVNGADGTRVWRSRVGKAIQSPPALGDDHVYAITVGKLAAINRKNGNVVWRADIGNTHYSTVVTTPGSVVVGGPTMYAFDHAGDVRWTREIPAGNIGSYGEPAVVDGEVFAGVCIKETSNSLYDNYVYRMQ